ncbi:hypothetical protein GTY87_24055 [Streptomyces sp. SID7813]|uniref:Membrane protein n=1 Tax=Streptomyces coelicolor (strain ATCC BAA-471 / A3(2) / M145) TaxID=100226 RepID=Q9L0E9_STRCO|nr:hypothetical protein [Streptomyces sp. SID7813]QFI44625.1 hypothetical protein FQ762_24275 [Streptomyces coelicolor A3(2)]CAB82061.1 putative membrane protein [Streptomyces coelicolor A3(2)]
MVSRPRRRRPAASSTRETIQPPGTGQLVVWMVTVTLLVAVVGSLANSGMALVGLLVLLPAAAAAHARCGRRLWSAPGPLSSAPPLF